MKNLLEIEKRWKKATPGPWRLESYVDAGGGRHIAACTSRNGVFNEWVRVSRPFVMARSGVASVTDKQRDLDAVAIAHAPEDVSVLIAEVRRLHILLKKKR